MLKKLSRKLSINAQMLLFVLGTAVLIFVLSIGCISYNSHKKIYAESVDLAKAICQQSALEVEKELDRNMDIVRTLAQAYGTFHHLPTEQWKDLFSKMYRRVYESNPQFYKLWDSWELCAIDSTYTKDYGRFVITYYREDGEIKSYTTLRSIDGDPTLYAKIKSEATETLWEPYWDVFVEEGADKQLMTSMSVPINHDGEYVGIVAADITIKNLQEIVQKVKPFEGSYAFLVSNSGVFVSYPEKETIGKKISEYAPHLDVKFGLTEKISRGENFDIITIDPTFHEESLVVFNQVQVGESALPWTIAVVIPTDVMLRDANNNLWLTLLIALLGIIGLTLIICKFSDEISRAMKLTRHTLDKMAMGDLNSIEEVKIKRFDEIAQMANSLNKLSSNLNQAAQFALGIAKGDLEQDFHLLSNKDVLGNALLDMRESLQKADEVEKERRDVEEKQRWVTEGLAKFGEILRNNINDLKQLSFHFMSNLINYLEVNQGALFVCNEDSDGVAYLEMTSATAYSREKYVKKRVKIGEDLVGRCAHEKMTIYMTDIPDRYIEITSGMGTANPRCLILVPLFFNDQVYGVIEMASFQELEPYQIDFIEKIGQSVASTISTIRINETTQKLLEQSQMQSEELAAQEEEMRQNLEELQTVQEESTRKESEMQQIIKALDASTYNIEYDLEGRIIRVNNAVTQLFGVSNEQIIGTFHKDGVELATQASEYEQFWNDLKSGIPRKEITHVTFKNRNFVFSETYTPILDENDLPYKILKVGFNITDLQQEVIEKETEIKNLQSQIVSNEILRVEPAILVKPDDVSETKKSSSKSTAKEISHPAPLDESGIELSEECLTGIAEIDEQHAQIVLIVNQLQEAFLNKKSKKEIKELIKNLADFSAYHFSSEERYFDQFDYEKTMEHHKEHKVFTNRILNFRKAYQAGEDVDVNEFITFTRQWMIDHFSGLDQNYIVLFKENGL